ncbi:unnamed protein product, partial [Coregonus sp. 'balchen']
LGCDSEADGEPGSEAKGHHGSSLSIVFDEDKPIAASGRAYNLDQLIAAAAAAEAQSRSLLTRSLSLQAGELDGSDPLDGEGSSISIGDSRPLAEAFSVDSGTESAPGTLRRPSKKGPLLPGGSLKKKPLSRQSSNVESPQPPSSGTTPELKKSANPSRAVSPLLGSEDPQVGGATVDSAPGPTSATPSPEGTLCRTRKPCVESPTPLIEETNHTSPETDSQLILAPTSILTTTQAISIPFQQEDTPISVPEAPPGSEGSPPSGAYKWDPDNFENIDPFNTGGSKVANSPPLGRKGVANSPPLGRKGVVLSIAPKTVAPVSNPNPPERPPTISNDEPALPSTSPPIRTSGAEAQEGQHPVTVPDDVPVPKASYIFDPTQWDDPNINPFGSNAGIPISPKLNKPSYSFDPDAFHDSAVNPFKGSSNRMAEFPPKAASGSASFEVSANDNEVDNDNDEVRELEDHNRNRPAKTKKKPIKSNTFRVKRSPKRSPTSDPSSQGPTPVDEAQPPLQDDHATDEEKLASSSNHKEKLVSSANHKWASMEAELTSDPQEDFPQPSDLTAFVNENSRGEERRGKGRRGGKGEERERGRRGRRRGLGKRKARRRRGTGGGLGTEELEGRSDYEIEYSWEMEELSAGLILPVFCVLSVRLPVRRATSSHPPTQRHNHPPPPAALQRESGAEGRGRVAIELRERERDPRNRPNPRTTSPPTPRPGPQPPPPATPAARARETPRALNPPPGPDAQRTDPRPPNLLHTGPAQDNLGAREEDAVDRQPSRPSRTQGRTNSKRAWARPATPGHRSPSSRRSGLHPATPVFPPRSQPAIRRADVPHPPT